ncbi:MAG: glycosyltransferase family 4 protein [Polyangiaceae bacterium]|nr:glycosyltransferase family 4 protein [Polyangiaceae bacterium]
MRIVLILGYPTRSRGGTEIAALSFASGLAQRGHTITTICNHEGELVAEYERFCHRVFVLKKPRDLGALLPELATLVRSRNVLVYGHNGSRIVSLILLARALRAKCVCHLHLYPNPMGRAARWALNDADRLLTLTEATAAAWRRAFDIPSSKVRIIPNGIDTMRFGPEDPAVARASFGLPPGARVVSYVGRLDPQKGVDVLIRAFGLVCERSPTVDSHLLIAGSTVLAGDGYLRELQGLAATSAGHRVRFIGRIADPERLFRASDVSVLPSVGDEALGLTLLESMACGVPAIGSTIGGIPEVLGPDFPEHLFSPGSVEELAACMSSVLAWREGDPTLGARCRDVAVKKYGIEVCVDRIEREFLELINA